jgi:medium-chain acyl-[acyl-carrier-protein] hydrolase
VYVPVASAAPDVVVICVGPSGAGASYWTDVGRRLPGEVELRALRLPGRESRFVEPPYVSMTDLVEATTPILAESVRAGTYEYVVAGVCGGAVVAFELCAALSEQGVHSAAGFIAFDRSTLEQPVESTPWHELPSAELYRRLRNENALIPAVAANPGLFDVFEPAIRADFAVVESHHPAPDRRLDCPVVVASGDPVELRRETTWARRTTGQVLPRLVAGMTGSTIHDPDRFAADLCALLNELRST